MKTFNRAVDFWLKAGLFSNNVVDVWNSVSCSLFEIKITMATTFGKSDIVPCLQAQNQMLSIVCQLQLPKWWTHSQSFSTSICVFLTLSFVVLSLAIDLNLKFSWIDAEDGGVQTSLKKNSLEKLQQSFKTLSGWTFQRSGPTNCREKRSQHYHQPKKVLAIFSVHLELFSGAHKQ